MLLHLRRWQLDHIRCIAGHRPLDATSHLIGCGEQETVHGSDVAARNSQARVTKQCLDCQLGQTQFVSRAGIGMPEAMRRLGLTDNSPPRLREDGRVGFFTARHAGKDVIALALNSLQDGLGG